MFECYKHIKQELFTEVFLLSNINSWYNKVVIVVMLPRRLVWVPYGYGTQLLLLFFFFYWFSYCIWISTFTGCLDRWGFQTTARLWNWLFPVVCTKPWHRVKIHKLWNTNHPSRHIMCVLKVMAIVVGWQYAYIWLRDYYVLSLNSPNQGS